MGHGQRAKGSFLVPDRRTLETAWTYDSRPIEGSFQLDGRNHEAAWATAIGGGDHPLAHKPGSFVSYGRPRRLEGCTPSPEGDTHHESWVDPSWMKGAPIVRYGYTPQDEAVTDMATWVFPSRRRGRPSDQRSHRSRAKGWRVGVKDTAIHGMGAPNQTTRAPMQGEESTLAGLWPDPYRGRLQSSRLKGRASGSSGARIDGHADRQAGQGVPPIPTERRDHARGPQTQKKDRRLFEYLRHEEQKSSVGTS